MLIPAPAEALTIYLEQDFALSYSIQLDLTGCTLYSDITIARTSTKVASFVMTITGTGNPSTFTRTLAGDAMGSLIPGNEYTTDIFVKYPSLLVDKLTETGPVVVKPYATVVP